MSVTLDAPHRVLLVEDSEADVFLMETMLELSGLPLELNVAGDGVLALEKLEACAQGGGLPELLLLDLNMPRMNGFEVLEHLKTQGQYGKLPVVVLTTSAATHDRLRALELGASAYVTKPSGFGDLELLMGQVVKVLQGQEGWDSL